MSLRAYAPRSIWAFLCALAGLALSSAAPGVLAAGPSARQIMSEVEQTRKLDGSEAVVMMQMNDGKGHKRERKIAMATKLVDDGKTEKRIYRFLSPEDVKGTGILVFDYDTKADDIWIYLPALHKTRRILSSDRSKSFMGSDFSYGDLNIPPIDDYTYTLVKEESSGGEPCWVIDVFPKSAKIAEEEGYKKKTLWISKKTHTVRKGLYFDIDGKLKKSLSTGDVVLLDKKKRRYRAKRMEMKNVQTGTSSVFVTTDVKFVPDTKDEYFTTRYLER